MFVENMAWSCLILRSFIFKFSNLDNSFQHVTKMQQNSYTFLLKSPLIYNEIWLSPFTDDHQTTFLSKLEWKILAHHISTSVGLRLPNLVG